MTVVGGKNYTKKQISRMFKTNESSIWAISEKSSGKLIATYRAFTAQEAFNRLVRDDAATSHTFRKSQPASRWNIENCDITRMAI